MLKKLKQQILTEGGSFPVFLDNQSTTVVDPVVLNNMLPFFNIKYGNPHSRSHVLAWEAEEACEISRELIARVIGANKKEIIFTSGATESNNLAIKGVSMFYKDKRKHIITLMTEHKCVLDTCRVLERNGFYVTYLPVETNGIVNLNQLAEVITQDTLLVSIMAVNNEIGVIQPLKEIGQICKEKEVFFHSDIAQGFGKIPINVDDMHIDLASISGHKIYAPKGIGALYIRRRDRRVRLVPLINGGGQERGFRSGTLSTPLVVGLGIAAKIAVENMHDNFLYIKRLFNFFVSEIEKKVDMVFLNGDKYQRYPGNVNFSFAFVEGESLILAVSDLAISSGSACTSNSLESSYVLKALGVDDALAHTSLRFGFSKFTTLNEVKFASELLISKIARLRNLSPLWEMYKNGINIKSIKWNMH